VIVRWLLAALLALLGGLAHAGIIINPYIFAAAGTSIVDGPTGPPVAASYGADPDGGEVDDPTLAATFSLGATYYAGTIVNNGSGTYYYSLKSNTNAPLANTTYWRQITNVYYFDTAAGNDANAQNTCTTTGTTNATLAKANPCQTALRASDLVDSSGSPNNATAPLGSLILLKRGQTYSGHFFYQGASSTASFILGAWGTGARPVIQYSISGGAQVDGDAVVKLSGAGSPNGGGIVRNVTIDAQYIVVYRYTAGAGTFANGDVITQTSDGLKQGTVQEQRTFSGNTYVSVIHTSKSDIMSGSVAFQTSGGTKTGTTVGTGTQIAGIISSNPNWSAWNFTIQNTVNNGLGGGTYGDMTKAVNIVVYNGLIQDSALNGGNGAGSDIQYGSNVKILHVSFKDNGSNATFAHNLYYDDLNNLELGWIHSYMTRGDRGNHCIVLHGTMDTVWIHDSLLDGCQNGLGINDGYHGTNFNGAESFTNFTVERVVIRNMGTFAGPGQAMDLAGVTNSVFRNNLAYNNGYPVNYKDRNHTGANPTVSSTGNAFVCNTFVAPTTATLSTLIIAGSTLGATTFTNNIIESKSATTTVYAVNWDALGTAPTMTYNNIYNPNFTGTIRWGSTTYSVASPPSGTNGNSTAVAPTFVNEAGGNFAVSGSPKTLGTPLATCLTDIAGTTRSLTTPTMGAYE
jgi:hypothetical protein